MPPIHGGGKRGVARYEHQRTPAKSPALFLFDLSLGPFPVPHWGGYPTRYLCTRLWPLVAEREAIAKAACRTDGRIDANLLGLCVLLYRRWHGHRSEVGLSRGKVLFGVDFDDGYSVTGEGRGAGVIGI